MESDSDRSAASQLLEIEAIKRLKARYFRSMDTKRWDEFAAVFSPDAELDVTEDAGPEAGRVSGRSAIARFIRQAVGRASTVHHGHMPEIELTGPTSATGIWAMSDLVEFPSEDQKQRVGLQGYGHYIERYEKLEGRWHIAQLKLARLRIDPLG